MIRRDYLTRFQPAGTEPLANKPIAVFLIKRGALFQPLLRFRSQLVIYKRRTHHAFL